MMTAIDTFIKQVNFNAEGLVASIAQEVNTNKVLMLAWQNAESLRLSLEKMEMVYFSRSRQQLWHKGEVSGHTQKIHTIAIDCDGDAVLAKITQIGGIACHTGRKSCFYQTFSSKLGIINNTDIIKHPTDIYGKNNK
ncbi:MAG: phosphoribosyl-AMP cyclohydrolase [Ostreibacterium sp.]